MDSAPYFHLVDYLLTSLFNGSPSAKTAFFLEVSPVKYFETLHISTTEPLPIS
jgi:hypothetical protein